MAAFCCVTSSSCPHDAVDLLKSGRLLLGALGDLLDDFGNVFHAQLDLLESLSGVGDERDPVMHLGG